MKRQESIAKLRNLHDEQKRAIKNALLSIDSAPRSNKIVFEPPEVIETEYPTSSNKRKAQLFEEEEEEEAPAESFKVKKQFAGKNGEKLFELQTRFQNDKRFEIDEKFAEGVDEELDSKKRYTREQLKERKQMRKEMINWDQNEMKEERDNQLSILQGITGVSTGAATNSFQKPPQKGMLRYDPSKKEHMKYLDLVRGDDDDDDEDMERDKQRANAVEVSDEQFYEVSDNLAQSLQQKSETTPFSIFAMLGVSHDDEVEEEEEETVEIKTIAKLPTFPVNQPRFRYDSSDTDEDAEEAKSKQKQKKKKTPAKGGKYSKTGIWRANFFAADGDERLKEAFTFIKAIKTIPAEEFDASRNKLKQVIRKKQRRAMSDKRRSENSSKKRKAKNVNQ